jgi:hypothetical protein
MKTDDLIAMLATNVEPVDHRQVRRTVSLAIIVGTTAALGVMLFLFGVRADLNATGALIFLLLKLAFTMAHNDDPGTRSHNLDAVGACGVVRCCPCRPKNHGRGLLAQRGWYFEPADVQATCT